MHCSSGYFIESGIVFQRECLRYYPDTAAGATSGFIDTYETISRRL